ncbi:MAG: 3-hydroxyacyl-[acyl-carrier-protein] dehydratase FabZ [Alphaproteobacteria bacterium CG_4_9_14_3_um_filter_47_13]|nr:MAG: 3-hydroxyacyl-[acyl-carrier-protein] dehydratase FabZ [Alphaproteobacteria bacterium CG_4_9_14_3_um_filter_47_13]
MSEQIQTIDISRIMEMLPHRYPFLLVDRIINFVPNESAIGLKNVSFNEPQFQGHFPSVPVMPGVLIIEAMAQTAAIVVVESLKLKSAGSLVYFMTIDEARFRKPVIPGDSMHIHVNKVHSRKTVWKFKGEARVGDTLCAEATFSAMIVQDEAAQD